MISDNCSGSTVPSFLPILSIWGQSKNSSLNVRSFHSDPKYSILAPDPFVQPVQIFTNESICLLHLHFILDLTELYVRHSSLTGGETSPYRGLFRGRNDASFITNDTTKLRQGEVQNFREYPFALTGDCRTCEYGPARIFQVAETIVNDYQTLANLVSHPLHLT